MQPIFPRLIIVLLPIFLSIQFLDAADMQPAPSDAPSLDATDVHLVQYDDQNDDDDVYDEDVESVDVWYGPGFYYGFWFGNESDYWGWRHNHRHYPSNRNYYHPSHPVHYNAGNRGGGNRGGGSRGGHGGGGGHR